jgi:hypothetical protein
MFPSQVFRIGFWQNAKVSEPNSNQIFPNNTSPDPLHVDSVKCIMKINWCCICKIARTRLVSIPSRVTIWKAKFSKETKSDYKRKWQEMPFTCKCTFVSLESSVTRWNWLSLEGTSITLGWVIITICEAACYWGKKIFITNMYVLLYLGCWSLENISIYFTSSFTH